MFAYMHTSVARGGHVCCLESFSQMAFPHLAVSFLYSEEAIIYYSGSILPVFLKQGLVM